MVILLAGCNHDSQAAVINNTAASAQISAWLAYWDVPDAVREVKGLQDLRKLSYFAVGFDQGGQLCIPDDLTEALRQTGGRTDYEKYLTFVNDQQVGEDKMLLKDLGVLRKVFASEQAMDKHIAEILALTSAAKCDGVEIDYETIWKDARVSEGFLKFIPRLYERAKAKNLKLRVVLEPSTPFARINFIEGPEYVVMFYNYHGTHSITPGPKANKTFIQRVLKNIATLPATRSVAFSTGGCIWELKSIKSNRFLTEKEAASLAVENEATPKRDKESQCLVFDYVLDGRAYTVWYADRETLNYWISLAKAAGESNISLWRLGGNRDIHKVK